jgi:uncharacterized alkaline shock family protein YloU
MSEQDRQSGSPLASERGVTNIDDRVVSTIAGMAAGEVPGVHLGGSASRSAGGVIGGITGRENHSRGVSVEVGRTQVAIDFTLGIDYGRNILEAVEEVRRRVIERVQNMTGLEVTETNAKIADIVFSEGTFRGGCDDGGQSGREMETREMSGRELRPGASERETASSEPRSRTRTDVEGGHAREEVRVRREPQDETAELKVGENETEERRARESGERRRRRSGER